jgi:hypothetical protein
MASTITNFSSIVDVRFPVPGQDNDTQGFRNNFGNLVSALDAAATEITDLQITNLGIINQINSITTPENIVASTVLTSALTATNITASGNIAAGAFIGDGSQLTNISIGNSFGTLNIGGELRAGNTFITGELSATSIVSPGTVQAGQFVGDGSLLTGLPTPSISNITNFNITGTISARTLSVTDRITAGSFAGDGSRITNVPLPNTTNRLRITQLAQIDNTASINNLLVQNVTVANDLFVIGDALVTGTITGSFFVGDGSKLTGVEVNNITSIGTLTNLKLKSDVVGDVTTASLKVSNNTLIISGITQITVEGNVSTTATLLSGTFAPSGGTFRVGTLTLNDTNNISVGATFFVPPGSTNKLTVKEVDTSTNTITTIADPTVFGGTLPAPSILTFTQGVLVSQTAWSNWIPASSKGRAGDKIGMSVTDGAFIYMCYADYTTGTDDIWAKVATVGVTW